jgi:Putative RNA methylase family UPF0020
MASIRCIAPLLALVQFQEYTSTSNSRRGSSNRNGSRHVDDTNVCGHDSEKSLDETKSLDYVVQKLKDMVSSPQFDMTGAMNLWNRHVRYCWNNDSNESNVQNGHELSSISKPQRTGDEKKKKKKLTYRLSCMRPDSKYYSYTREELLTKVPDFLVPPPPETAHHDYDDSSSDHDDDDDDDDVWKVDLKQYNLEIVLLMRAQFVAVALSLRPYPQLGTACFGSGKCPPDVAPPYLTGGEMSGLVRLRPSTAQVLLHLANVQIGDVLLDPCAGIGTIPIETMFLPRCSIQQQQPALALGGDLVLSPNSNLASIATTYENAARRVAADLASERAITAENLLAWDASHLPIRSGCVDVIVSDLPFGHKCLSSKKLSQFLPILLTQLARVLRPGTGRMILLCGYYLPILEELRRANNENNANDSTVSRAHDTIDTNTHAATTTTKSSTVTCALPPVWTLPCQAVFPANIGGHLAWVIQVRRGMGMPRRITCQLERVRKLAHTRERNARCIAMNDDDNNNGSSDNKTNNQLKASKKNHAQS